jgi:hypothetical protein
MLIVLATRPALAEEGPEATLPVVSRYAVVVGAPHAVDLPIAKDLAYADDDALTLHAVLSAAGVKTRLLTVPDTPTQQLHPNFRRDVSGRPMLGEVQKALQDVARDAIAEKSQYPTRTVDIIFFFSGHGGAGMLKLADKLLTGKQVYDMLIEKTKARDGKPGVDHVHLLIDACGVASSLMTRSFTRELKLAENPQVGVLLAMTAESETLEWDVIGSGVFSYELRSGLMGGADLGKSDSGASQQSSSMRPNRSVEYLELGAFVASANDAVKDPQARIYPVQRLPGGSLDEPILSFSPAGLGTDYAELILPADQEVWIRVAEERIATPTAADRDHGRLGQRLFLAEVHAGVRQAPTVLRLPMRDRYEVQEVDQTGAYVRTVPFVPATDGVSVSVDKLFQAVPSNSASAQTKKGNLAPALKAGLFRVPHDEARLAAYQPVNVPGDSDTVYVGTRGPPAERKRSPPAPPPQPTPPPQSQTPSWGWPIGLCIGAGVGTALTLTTKSIGDKRYEEWSQATNLQNYERLEEETRRLNWITTVAFTASIAAGVGCVGTLIHATSIAAGSKGGRSRVPNGVALTLPF